MDHYTTNLEHVSSSALCTAYLRSTSSHAGTWSVIFHRLLLKARSAKHECNTSSCSLTWHTSNLQRSFGRMSRLDIWPLKALHPQWRTANDVPNHKSPCGASFKAKMNGSKQLAARSHYEPQVGTHEISWFVLKWLGLRALWTSEQALNLFTMFKN